MRIGRPAQRRAAIGRSWRRAVGLTFSGALSAVLVSSASAAGFAASASTFALSNGVNSGPNAIAAVDLNADGRTDLVTADGGSQTVGFLLNGGSGSFTAGTDFGVSPTPNALAIGDLNGDGRLDIAVTQSTANRLSLLFADPNGLTYSSEVDIATGAFPDGVAIGDFNGDGLPDVAEVNGTDGTLWLFDATAPGVYPATPTTTLTTGTNPGDVAVADLSGDGRPDLVVTNKTSNTVSVFLANPGATSGYTTQTLSTGVGTGPVSVAIGDFNGDGMPDLAVAYGTNDANGDRVALFLAIAPGVYPAAPTLTLAAGKAPTSVVIGDFNGDGLPDVAVTNKLDNTVDVFLQDSGGGTYSTSTLPVGNGPVGLTAGDFSGDGKPDLATADVFAGDVTLLTQTLPAAPMFTADTPPLSATVGLAYSYAFAASGHPAATFAVTSGTLPSGLSLDASTGILSGTPNASGGSTFTVGATNDVGSDATSGPITITVGGAAAPPVFTADTPPTSANVGVPISYEFAATGNPKPAFSIASGTPPGTFSGASLGGFPPAPGTYTFTVRASNGVGPDALTPPISITVAAGEAAPSFTADSPPNGVVGGSYSYQFYASGNPAPTFNVTSGQLPPGLSISNGGGSLGVLSGTTTTPGTYAFTLTATNGISPDASAPLTITVPSGNAAPILTADAPGPAIVGTAYSYTFAASGNPAPTFALASGSLPAGLSLNQTTGTVSGTPASPESGTFTVGVSNGVGSAAVSPQVTITAPGFTADMPPATATVGTPYDYAFAAPGNPAPSFDFFSGASPDGLTLNGATGVLSGTPTVSGSFTFQVATANGTGGGAVGAVQTITVAGGPPVAPAFTADSPPDLAAGGSVYSYTFTASGNPSPNFAIASGALPPGLRLASFTGVLSGVPTTPGTYSFTLSASDGASPNATSPSLSITVTAGSLAAPQFTAAAPPASTVVGGAYSYAFTAPGNPAPTFALGSGALPDGLAFNPSTGVLSGTPTTAGTFAFTVTATNGVAPDATSGPLSITVAPAPAGPVFTAARPPVSGTIGTAYSPYDFTATGVPPPSFVVSSGTLPAGLSLDRASGILSGTPIATGSSTFTVGATNGVGQDATSGSITITIGSAPAFTADAPPAFAIVDNAFSYTFAASGSPAPTFALASGTLPAGLSLDPASGVLSGTPTAVGSATFTLRASNAFSPDAVTPAITITAAFGSAPAQDIGLINPPSPPKPATPAPANVVRFAKLTVSRKGVIDVEIAIPGAGRLVVRSSSTVQPKKPKHARTAPKPKTIAYTASLAAARSSKATVRLALTPGKTGAAALRLYKKLRVVVSVTFTPTGGTAHTQTTTTTVGR